MGGVEKALFWPGMCSHELMRRNTVPSSSSMPSVRREVLCSSIQGCQITTAARAAFCPTTCPENCPTGLCHPEENSDKHVTNLRRREDGTLQRPLCPRSSSSPPPPPPPMGVNNPLLVGCFDPFRRCCAVALGRLLPCKFLSGGSTAVLFYVSAGRSRSKSRDIEYCS